MRMAWTPAAAIAALLVATLVLSAASERPAVAVHQDDVILSVEPMPPPDFDDHILDLVPPTQDWRRRGSTTGAISGSLGFPSEAVPPLLVYAIRVDIAALQFASIRTVFNQLEYSIGGLEPGIYIVLAYLESTPAFAGGYTYAVPCGLTVACTDHALIPVAVIAGETVTGVDIRDWYAPPGSFPPRPDGPP